MVPSTGWPAKGSSVAGVKNPDARARYVGGQDEDRLGVVHLACEVLHGVVVQLTAVGEDGELVARQRRVGEHVGDHVTERRHGGSLRRRAPCPRPPCRSSPGDPDELRALTPEGHERARQLGERLRADGIEPAVLSSPLLRARETAVDSALARRRHVTSSRPARRLPTSAPPSPISARPWSSSDTSPTAARSRLH